MSGTDLAVARLSARLVRRGGLLLALATGLYVLVELVSYLASYPDAASRARLASFQDNPAVRMLQGIPHGVDTPGGFVAWDGGWMLEGIVGVWALLTVARLLRGEEDADRIGMVLAGPVRATRAMVLQLAVIGAVVGLVGLSAGAVLAAYGTGLAGSAIFGLGLAGFAATFAALAAVAAQVFGVRRRVVGVAAGAFGVLLVVRMVANSGETRGWLRWLTPFGWMEELRPYADPRWPALVALLAAPVLLGAAAVTLRGRRDTGGALLPESDRRRPHLRQLDSPLAFAWRSARGVLAGWLVGLAGYAFMIGTLLKTVVDYVADDPNYRRILEAMGMDPAQVTKGLVGVMAVLLGLGAALYACWRVGAARTEEAAGRAEHLLTRPVPRWRWLGGHAALALAGSALLTTATGLALWTGAAIGGADLAAGAAVAAMLNTLPLAVLFGGLAVLAFGVLPRLTVALSVGAALVGYLVEVLGPALRWPTWLLNISPFHHLAAVPAEPFAPTAAAVLVGLGLAAALAGAAAFERRDLAGA